MTTRFADHLLTGTHAARPAATAVPAGTLYSCTTHGLIYQSDGATWSTYATLGTSYAGPGTDTIWDAKGDMLAASAADTAARLPVGSNDQVLTADSGQTLGVKWATPAAGPAAALTLIQTITRGSTGSIDFTSIPGTYNDLLLVGLIRSSRSTVLTNCGLQYNGDTGNNYSYTQLLLTGTTLSNATTNNQPMAPYIMALGNSATAGSFTVFTAEIIGYAAATGHKHILISYASQDTVATTQYSSTGGGRWQPGTPAAITRVSLWDNVLASNSFVTGSTVRLYGRT